MPRRLATSLLLLAVAACAQLHAPDRRPVDWAVPITGVEGIANLHRVSSQLYRSEQPSEEGLRLLCDGRPLEPGVPPIRTVVSLRAHHDADGDVLAHSSRVSYVRIRFDPWSPNDDEVARFLQVVTTEPLQPVLVHCERGADRTGMMVAVYRVVVQGWSREDALKEMTEGGYGFHSIWKDVQSYVRELDVEKIRAKVAALGPWRGGDDGKESR